MDRCKPLPPVETRQAHDRRHLTKRVRDATLNIPPEPPEPALLQTVDVVALWANELDIGPPGPESFGQGKPEMVQDPVPVGCEGNLHALTQWSWGPSARIRRDEANFRCTPRRREALWSRLIHPRVALENLLDAALEDALAAHQQKRPIAHGPDQALIV